MCVIFRHGDEQLKLFLLSGMKGKITFFPFFFLFLLYFFLLFLLYLSFGSAFVILNKIIWKKKEQTNIFLTQNSVVIPPNINLEFLLLMPKNLNSAVSSFCPTVAP